MADENKLYDTVKECIPLMEHYEQQGYNKTAWWDAVAGRMLPDVLVTGNACRHRWNLIRKRAEKEPKKDYSKQWEVVEQRVEEYEQSLIEEVRGGISDILRMVRRVEDRTAAMYYELTGKTGPTLEEKE